MEAPGNFIIADAPVSVRLEGQSRHMGPEKPLDFALDSHTMNASLPRVAGRQFVGEPILVLAKTAAATSAREASDQHPRLSFCEPHAFDPQQSVCANAIVRSKKPS